MKAVTESLQRNPQIALHVQSLPSLRRRPVQTGSVRVPSSGRNRIPTKRCNPPQPPKRSLASILWEAHAGADADRMAARELRNTPFANRERDRTDIVANAYIRFARAIDKGRELDNPAAFITATIRQEARTLRRRRARERDNATVELTPDVASPLQQADETGLLETIVSRLPEELQSTARALATGASWGQIAVTLKIGKATVQRRITRIREILS